MQSLVSNGNQEIFPDLHHKMSKKIAQLTKVIYQLNTRNEDNQALVEAIESQHRNELDSVVKEANIRFAQIAKAIDDHQSIVC